MYKSSVWLCGRNLHFKFLNIKLKCQFFPARCTNTWSYTILYRTFYLDLEMFLPIQRSQAAYRQLAHPLHPSYRHRPAWPTSHRNPRTRSLRRHPLAPLTLQGGRLHPVEHFVKTTKTHSMNVRPVQSRRNSWEGSDWDLPGCFPRRTLIQRSPMAHI